MVYDNLFNFPEELRRLPQWLLWRAEETQGGKTTKIPYQPRNGLLASVTDPTHWATFNEVYEALAQPHGYTGAGFVFTPHDPYAGIDLDNSADPETIAQQIRVFEAFDSYSELSPSGNGLHIIVKANVPSGRRRSSIELYSSHRFFTVTGKVYKAAPVADRQELAMLLWEQLGKGGAATKIYGGTFDETESDDQIIERALRAVNGDKFRMLLDGKWNEIYPSQSEADFAFVDIIAFYTQNRNQIVRMFRASPLGRRDKAKRSDYVEYMVNKSFDRMLSPVDIEGLRNVVEEVIATKAVVHDPASSNGRTTAFDAANLGSNPGAGTKLNPYSVPPGMLGELANFIYDAAPRPVPEIALAAAIAFMAGVCGRAYNVSGTGLNQYVLLLAPTGTGKEAMASGIDKLMNTMKTDVPASRQFIGPAEIASGQALLKFLGKSSPCFLSIVGEFGLKMQQLSSRTANAAEMMLKRVLLDLYNKSGHGKILQASIYSQKENNTDAVASPAVTLLGESTPETFFASIDETMIADGLLPRFLLVEYDGQRPKLNPAHLGAYPSATLVNMVKALTAHSLTLMQANSGFGMVINVELDEEARLMSDAFDAYADEQINGSNVNVIRHLWNRAHIKLLKLAALVAVGCDPYHPLITVQHLLWAKAIVEHDIRKLLDRFERGEIGKDSEESKQHNEVVRIIRDYVMNGYEAVAKYGVPANLHNDKLVPYIYVNKRLVAAAAFRHDKAGATNAIKRTLQSLCDSGVLREVGRNELATKYGQSQRTFAIADVSILR